MRLLEVAEAAIKLSSSGKRDPAVDEFMEKYYKVTQKHPFDPAARIAWDGKSTVTIQPFNDYINLSAIQTLAPGERSGSANGVVMTLVAIADETGVPVRLSAKPFGTSEGRLTKRQLMAWYKRRGFVSDSGSSMTYTPQKSLDEETPPGMEGWIKKRKPEFKKRYGDDWESVLYATAWKQHNAS